MSKQKRKGAAAKGADMDATTQQAVATDDVTALVDEIIETPEGIRVALDAFAEGASQAKELQSETKDVRDGAYTSLMEAARLYADAASDATPTLRSETWKGLVKSRHAAWKANPAKYGRVLEKAKDGETYRIGASCRTATSIIADAFALDLSLTGLSFGEIRKAVKEEKHDLLAKTDGRVADVDECLRSLDTLKGYARDKDISDETIGALKLALRALVDDTAASIAQEMAKEKAQKVA